MGVIYVKLSWQPCFRTSESKIPETCNASGLFSRISFVSRYRGPHKRAPLL